MKISCIIVNWNLKYLPRLCIEAIRRCKCDFPFEIIVVDNNSDDESLDYLKQMHGKGEIKLVHAGANLGYGKANNLGARHAKGDYLLILNPDVSVDSDALQNMADYMDSHKEIGVLGPQLYFFNGQIQDSCRRFMRPFDLLIKRTFLSKFKLLNKRVKRYVMADFDRKEAREVDFLVGACFMVRKSVFEKVGGFDERFFLFMEDTDLCRRIWESGHKIVYFPMARALHFHKRLSTGGLLFLLRQRVFWIHLASAAKYFWKWRGKSAPQR